MVRRLWKKPTGRDLNLHEYVEGNVMHLERSSLGLQRRGKPLQMLLGGQEVRQIDLTIPVRAQLPAGTDELDEDTSHVTFSENATSLRV